MTLRLSACVLALCAALLAPALAPRADAQAPPFLTVDLELVGEGRNYDDICFWEHPTDPEQSLGFIASKEGPTVEVFRLVTGAFLASIGGFQKPNNCAVTGNLLLTTDAIAKRVLIHSIPDFTLVTSFDSGFSQPEGMAVLTKDGTPYAIVTDRTQNKVHVYNLTTFQFVRMFSTGFTANEGTVADDLYEHIIVTDGDTGRARVFTITGELLAEFGAGAIDNDAEGVAIYRCGAQGWILIADQLEYSGDPTDFEVFERTTFAHVGTFRLRNAAGNVTNATDGVDIFQVPTSLSASGLFAACDDCSNSGDDFDLIRWDKIATTFGLAICPRGRPPTCGNDSLDSTMEECDGLDDAACPTLCRQDCTCGPLPSCGDNDVNHVAEMCDGLDDAACPGACRADCTCPPPPVCGDGELDAATEECDVDNDAACPALCEVDCTCGPPPSGVMEADVSVQRKDASKNFGADPELLLDADTEKRLLFRIRVDGVGTRQIASVRLHLNATSASSAGSNSGGRIHGITSCAWTELGATWNNQPQINGPLLDTIGAVSPNDAVSVDLTPAVSGDGTYCFAMDTLSDDGVQYRSREAASGRPRIEIALVPHYCGDGSVNQPGEECDGFDDAACPGACDLDCGCPSAPSTTSTTTTTTVPTTTTTIPTTTTTVPITTTTVPTTTTTVPTTTTTVPTTTTTTIPPPVCGDGTVNRAAEQCDGSDALACPGSCRVDCTCPAPTASVIADTHVREDDPRDNYGTGTYLQLDRSSAKESFLRVQVAGIGYRRISRARVLLTVTDTSSAQSDSGGRIHSMANCTWNEFGLTWNNRPPIDGSLLDSSVGAVDLRDVVPFDITPAIVGNGTYCFGMDSPSSDGVKYDAREAGATGPRVDIVVEAPRCGDGLRNRSPEACDGADAAACPGQCLADCTCVAPSTTTTTIATTTTTVPTTTTTVPTTTTTVPTTTTTVPTTTTTVPTTTTTIPTTTTTVPTTTTTVPTTTTTIPTTTTTVPTTTTTVPTTTTTLPAPVGVILADVSAIQSEPGTSFGAAPELSVDGDSPKNTFLRIQVSGIGGRTVTSARLRLQAPDAKRADSDSGGRLHRISDCSWNELAVRWTAQPVIDGPPGPDIGPVDRGQTVEFDATAHVNADGIYCFALTSTSEDGVDYHSREATAGRPQFVVQVAGAGP
jgi:myo-inositol-hexaphosphate 3-phosphohydrolase